MWLVAFIMNLHILLLHAVHAGLGGLVVYGVAEGSQWHEMEINKTSKASLFFLPRIHLEEDRLHLLPSEELE